MNNFTFTLVLLTSCFVYLNVGAATVHIKSQVLPSQTGRQPESYDRTKESQNGALTKKGESKCVGCETKNAKAVATDCWDLLTSSVTTSGIYDIYPEVFEGNIKVTVWCDMETEGGGWTVIQRRDAQFKPRIDFYRDMEEYANGFGKLDEEFWLGLEYLDALTFRKENKLRVELSDFRNKSRHAEYSTFSVGSWATNYQLTIGNYTGNAGDAMSYNHGNWFSTKDEDNDRYPPNCVEETHGPWWHQWCTGVNLNGYALEGHYTAPTNIGIYWSDWHGYNYSLKTTEMKLRPVNANVTTLKYN